MRPSIPVLPFASVKFLVAAVALFTFEPRPGGISPEEATALLKESVAKARKKLQSDLKEVRAGFSTVIQEFESTFGKSQSILEQGLVDDATLAPLVSAIHALQGEVSTVSNYAVERIVERAADALADLGNAPTPKDFVRGSGRILDKALADVDRTIQELYGHVRSRLKRTVGFLAKKGLVASIDVRAPGYLHHSVANSTGIHTFRNDIAIDWILAVNDAGSSEGGRVYAGGQVEAFVDQVTVQISGAETESEAVDIASNRWDVHSNDGGSGFRRGNYVLEVRIPTDQFGAAAAFSIR